MNCKMNAPLSGIIPPLVTPLLDDDVLDVEGLNRLIEHLIAGGVHALFVLGTTGEAQSLSYKLRVEMIKNTCRITKGRLPVLVCISDTSIVESVNSVSYTHLKGIAAGSRAILIQVIVECFYGLVILSEMVIGISQNTVHFCCVFIIRIG